MAKPKSFDSWPPERQEEWLERQRQSRQKWEMANPDKVRMCKRNYRLANPKKALVSVRKWKIANPDKVRQHQRKWEMANPDKMRELARKKSKRQIMDISDSYIAQDLRLPAAFLRENLPNLLSVKRKQIQAKRHIKQTNPTKQ